MNLYIESLWEGLDTLTRQAIMDEYYGEELFPAWIIIREVDELKEERVDDPSVIQMSGNETWWDMVEEALIEYHEKGTNGK